MPGSLRVFEFNENESEGLYVPKNWATGVLTISENSLVWAVSSEPYDEDSEVVIYASEVKEIILPSNVFMSPKDKK